MFQGRLLLWTIVAGVGCLLAIFLTFSLFRYHRKGPIVLIGAVIKQDEDPNKQSPIMDVDVSEANGLAASDAKSNFTGYFAIPLESGVGRNRSVTLRFLHP